MPHDSVQQRRSGPLLASLRAHDLHQGLQAADVDRGSGLVGQELEATQTIGMAAALATAIKGLDIVADGSDLRRVANQQLDIPTWAFDKVIRVLEEAEYVRNVDRDSVGHVQRLYETVPEDFGTLYRTLDQVYDDQRPGELERTLIAVIDDLSQGPRWVDELDVDPTAIAPLLEIADAAAAIIVAHTDNRDVAYSPYFAYEHPDDVAQVVSDLDLDQVRRVFAKVRDYQGLPILSDDTGAVANGLVAAGLMAGPGVAGLAGDLQTFAIAPYGLASELLTIRKPVLDKALAIVASVRMGQHFGGLTHLRNPHAFLAALTIKDRWVGAHESTPRQYAALCDLGIVRLDARPFRPAIQLIDTRDNQEAIGLARDLLVHGEAMTLKAPSVKGIEAALYRSPIQTVRPARRRKPLPRKTISDPDIATR